MAIEIIKQPKTKFTMKCDRCGCEFRYFLTDIYHGLSDYLLCPCCGKRLFHKLIEEGTDV